MRYQISSFDYIKKTVAELSDDPTKHWSEYPCILWTRSKTQYGYGKLGKDGKQYDAHRLAFEFAYGEIPAGHLVCHHCDTPACFRPVHLFAGTYTDNIRDMVAKGRGVYVNHRKGSSHYASKLTEPQVLDIRKRYADGQTCSAIGRAYSVTHGCIEFIVTRASWKHL